MVSPLSTQVNSCKSSGSAWLSVAWNLSWSQALKPDAYNSICQLGSLSLCGEYGCCDLSGGVALLLMKRACATH